MLYARLLGAGFIEVKLNADHAVAAGALPNLHRDPFDRMLVAQAMIEAATLLTADRQLARYPGDIRFVG